MFVDSHCHLDKLDYQDLHTSVEDVVNKAKAANVDQLLSVGVTLDSFENMLEMISPFDNVKASCGVHPLDVESDFCLDRMREYASNPKVVAIGETGLDYHRNYSPQKEQKVSFENHVELAIELNMPLFLHVR